MLIESRHDIAASFTLKSNTAVIGEICLSPFTHIQSKDKLQSQHVAFMTLLVFYINIKKPLSNQLAYFMSKSFFLGQDDAGIIIVFVNHGAFLVARCLGMLY